MVGTDTGVDIQFAVLGPLEVTRDGRSADLGGPKPRTLLAMLLLSPGQPVGVEALIDALWGEEAPATSVKTIHKYVSYLRKQLGEAIVTRPGGYSLEVARDDIDVGRFEHMLERAGVAASEEEIVASLGDALSLWRGEAFSELPRSDFAVAERARLEERRLSATEELIQAELALGRHVAVVSRLEQLVAQHPLRERAWGQLMLALYRSGRQADALNAYQRLRRTLVDELAIEPSPELQILQKQILDHDEELAPPRTMSPDANRPVPRDLPAQLTSFVGRSSELEDITALLNAGRLVTLTGPAGSGKTRLALEVAAGAEFPKDGVWFVDLAAISSPDQVASAFAGAFRLGEQPGRSTEEVLAGYVAGKQALIVVDNCEHLVEGVAGLVAELLRVASGPRMLATSREPIAIPGEVIYEVAPLPVPAPGGDLQHINDSDSVRLFVERTRSVNTRFRLDADNAEDVAHICRRLDGIPLALELAAAALRAFGPHQLAMLLEDHFDLLAVAPRTAAPRHKTLRAAIDWSFDLLTDDERTLFRRVSVFQGGFELAAAVEVCADDELTDEDVLAVLPTLVAKSLVVAVRQRDGGTRYGLLETLRDYGRDRLEEAAESKAVRRRHAAYFRDIAEKADAAMRGPERDPWIERLGAENGNVRSALAWSLESGEIETGLRLAAAYFSYGAIFWFWDMRGTSPREGLRWLRKGLSRGGEVSDDVRARALAAAGFLAESQGEHEQATEFGRESLAIYRGLGDDMGAAVATLLLGETAHYQGDYGHATRLLERSLATFERLGEEWAVAWAQHRLGMVARLQGDYERAIELHEESLARFRAVGDGSRVAYALWALGVVARYQGDLARAAASCEESLELFEVIGERAGLAHVRATMADVARLQGDADRAASLYEESKIEFQELGDRRCVASTLANLGAIAYGRSDFDGARTLYQNSLVIRDDLGDIAGVAESLDGLGRLDGIAGRLDRAARLMGAADALREATGAAIADADRPAYDEDVAAFKESSSADDFSEAWRKGRAMTVRDAVALALHPSEHQSEDRHV